MKLPHSPVSRASKAFTLMEMMVVLAIIAMLIAVGAVTLKNIQDNAAITATQAQLGTLKSALLSYKTVNRKYPSELEFLVKPPADAVSKAPLTDERGLTDPWGEKYQMRKPGKKSREAFDLYSMGPDMKDGTEDDVYP